MNTSKKPQENHYQTKIEADFSIKNDLKKALDFLPNCEYELILYMSEHNLWKGQLPDPPTNFVKGEGAIELGLFLYWLNNPKLLDVKMFSLKMRIDLDLLIIALDSMIQHTKFTKKNYSLLLCSDLIYVDGTVLNNEKYATFDQGWFIAFLNLFITTIYGNWYNNGEFPTVTPPVIPISGKTVNIAILGDWGANNSNSQAVMKMIASLNPDYIIHVGDTYYGGTPTTMGHSKGYTYFDLGEESRKLIAPWPAGYERKSFTLNSNHEMYSGANGLFLNAYGAQSTPVGANTPFSAHQGSSCFALNFGGWTLLGLDTAFDGKVKNAFMAGSLGPADGTQANWVKSLNLDPKKTIVLSHHNGFEDDTNAPSPLWAEIQDALGGSDPFAWYWGHVHNGIVYNSPITIPTNPAKPEVPGFTTSTFARCLGHASMPYGEASSLIGKQIEYKTSNKKPKSNELYNGFAMLSLTMENGAVNSITEAFYDVSENTQQPAFKKRLL